LNTDFVATVLEEYALVLTITDFEIV